MAGGVTCSVVLPFLSEEGVELKEKIYIPSSTDNMFRSELTGIIDKIEANPIGKRLLDKIARYVGKVWILSAKETYVAHYTIVEPFRDIFSVIHFSTEHFTCLSITGEMIEIPNYIALFHELVHVYHDQANKRGSGLVDPLGWTNPEEYKAIVGFPSKNPERKTPKITENAFRAAEGLPLRGSHHTTGFPEWVKLRIRHLGKIYERHLADSDSSQAPPPVIKYSAENLGYVPEDCIVYAVISGVDSDLTPSEGAIGPHIMASATERIGDFMNSKCYADLSHLDSRCTREEIACTFFPKLKDVETFSVHLLMGIKITKEESELLFSQVKIKSL